MATLTIEYNTRNKTARQVINGLISAGVFRIREDEEKERAAIKRNIREVKKMIADIKENGSAGYESMDDFLKTLNH
jgi:hypothetical protein